jgi:uncharacterized membrane protein
MDKIRNVFGIIFLVIGFILLVISFFSWFAILYAIPMLIIGFLLLVDAGNEDKIESVKKNPSKN